MTKKIRHTGPVLRRIRHEGPVLNRMDPQEVAQALGAEPIELPASIKGSPLALFALRQEIANRLHSSGGRPALQGTTRRQKIPLSNEEWTKLEQLAETLTQEGTRVTAGQVASILLHRALEQVDAAGLRQHSR